MKALARPAWRPAAGNGAMGHGAIAGAIGSGSRSAAAHTALLSLQLARLLPSSSSGADRADVE
ncbi:hypothetical protein PF005_g22988 [Phytophthora fragariae]|uniref:Uncharacterized protein n=1 Tax=Phytophthora fragariae TaxID=53985 RepID=A0A6A3QZ84_9STRA|nr:hypothetical protein PF003_g2800 [Phytophthora fragariae]KAE8928355.1 hypothetical protein PF009_g21501 [Phytophthora fragariae]KAE8983851.1 hypothetical protein PF011_g21013 [Phytophthora fragariae]KAE9082410.1 hypothetical protein PF010_g21598 [Phytophthora fragariae]KAE9086626.1 hypothetical protein PF007_g20702 [Phytophthora fragariae]